MEYKENPFTKIHGLGDMEMQRLNYVFPDIYATDAQISVLVS